MRYGSPLLTAVSTKLRLLGTHSPSLTICAQREPIPIATVRCHIVFEMEHSVKRSFIRTESLINVELSLSHPASPSWNDRPLEGRKEVFFVSKFLPSLK